MRRESVFLKDLDSQARSSMHGLLANCVHLPTSTPRMPSMLTGSMTYLLARASALVEEWARWRMPSLEAGRFQACGVGQPDIPSPFNRSTVGRRTGISNRTRYWLERNRRRDNLLFSRQEEARARMCSRIPASPTLLIRMLLSTSFVMLIQENQGSATNCADRDRSTSTWACRRHGRLPNART